MQLTIITATYQRPSQLADICLPSLLAQSDRSFEWVVVNDGTDLTTRKLIESLQVDFPIAYLEMEHPTEDEGFGLCHARNLGLSSAKGEKVAYLDDDNAFSPHFVAAIKQFFEDSPTLQCALVQQNRRRDVVSNGVVRQCGKPFVSPLLDVSRSDLIQQKAIFDSNGFVHSRCQSPQWNPHYRVFADYEYFLQCLSLWGADRFSLIPQVLVDYIQTSEGIIGQSTYQQWAEELQGLCRKADQYSVLIPNDLSELKQLSEKWAAKSCQELSLFWQNQQILANTPMATPLKDFGQLDLRRLYN
jgi:glycosyltransferase involved in cell wall biosynthesis